MRTPEEPERHTPQGDEPERLEDDPPRDLRMSVFPFPERDRHLSEGPAMEPGSHHELDLESVAVGVERLRDEVLERARAGRRGSRSWRREGGSRASRGHRCCPPSRGRAGRGSSSPRSPPARSGCRRRGGTDLGPRRAARRAAPGRVRDRSPSRRSGRIPRRAPGRTLRDTRSRARIWPGARRGGDAAPPS